MLQRNHVLVVCTSSDNKEDQFWTAAWTARLSSWPTALVVDQPPPQREIKYMVHFHPKKDLFDISPTTVFAIAATDSVVLGSDSLVFFTQLKGAVARVAANNRLLKYYGLKLLFLIRAELTECDDRNALQGDAASRLYDFLRGWCFEQQNQYEIELSFDIVEAEDELKAVLRNELRRIKCGDFMAQCAGLPA